MGGALASGIIVLQSGASGDVIAISPPLVIDAAGSCRMPSIFWRRSSEAAE